MTEIKIKLRRISMEEVTKEEYLEAVKEGIHDAFSDGIGSIHVPSAAITEGVERSADDWNKDCVLEAISKGIKRSADDWLKDFIQKAITEGVERAISRTIGSERMIQAIKYELMKGEKPCKS